MRARNVDRHDAFDLAASPGFIIGQVSKTMAGKLAAELARHELTVPQWAVLTCLWQQDGLTQSELAERAGIDPATLAELLKRMTSRGLVRRVRDPHNNRFQRVYLVVDDTALRRATNAAAEGVNEQALRGFSDAERASLTTLLRRAIANLSRSQGDPE